MRVAAFVVTNKHVIEGAVSLRVRLLAATDASNTAPLLGSVHHVAVSDPAAITVSPQVARLLVAANVYPDMRPVSRWTVAISLAFALLMVGGGSAAAVRLKPRWSYLGKASGMLVDSRYAFVDNSIHENGQFSPGGTLIDEQTGRKTRIVPPSESGYSCGQASALGGPWLAFVCVLPAPTYQTRKYRLELYRIPIRRWRVVTDAVEGPVRGIGSDWIEYWAAYANAPQPQFVFQDIYTGQTQSLPGWQPGGRVIPNLNSPTLGRRLCSPVRVPDAWYGNDEDWPGTVSLFGSYVVVAGATRALQPFGYLERCGTQARRWIGPVGATYASANPHAVVWQPSVAPSDLQGAYLPTLKKFAVDTTDLVNRVSSPYYGGQNTYSVWLTSRTLYILVTPYSPADCTPDPCYAPPSQLYAAPAPREPATGRHGR